MKKKAEEKVICGSGSNNSTDNEDGDSNYQYSSEAEADTANADESEGLRFAPTCGECVAANLSNSDAPDYCVSGNDASCEWYEKCQDSLYCYTTGNVLPVYPIATCMHAGIRSDETV